MGSGTEFGGVGGRGQISAVASAATGIVSRIAVGEKVNSLTAGCRKQSQPTLEPLAFTRGIGAHSDTRRHFRGIEPSKQSSDSPS